MTWYAAHVVMVVEFKDAVQDGYPVWENIVLINAASEDEAFQKAEGHGRDAEGDDRGSFKWGKNRAKWVFAGVRKLTECVMVTESPDDGAEITFNELELPSQEVVKKFAQGKRVEVLYNDRFAAALARRKNAHGEPKHPKRKGA